MIQSWIICFTVTITFFIFRVEFLWCYNFILAYIFTATKNFGDCHLGFLFI